MDGWTLEYDGEEKPFAKRTIIDAEEVTGWGLANPVIQETNSAVGTCTFEQPGAEFESEPIFETGETVIIRLDGVRRFVGELRAPRRMGSSQSAGFAWRVENAWKYLEEIHYAQLWNKYAEPETSITELVTKYSSRLFLGMNENGALLTTAQQIIAVVDWAILQGAPLALDEDDIPSVQIPVMEVRDAFCSECIIKMLQLAPDAVCYFDYSTEPYPTLKIKRRGNYDEDGDYIIGMPSVELTPSAGLQISNVSIVPRDDLVARGWILNFERTDTVNGVPYRADAWDIYPVGIADLDDGAPVGGSSRRIQRATINLEGGVSSWAVASIVTTAITSNSANADVRAAWWKIKRPDLAKDTYQAGNADSTIVRKIVPGAGETAKDLITAIPRTGTRVYELVAGQYAEWMGGFFEDETIEATANYEVCQSISGADVVVQKFIGEPLAVKIKATSLTTGTYRSNGTSSPGESVPVGMARFLYESTSVLQYDGDLTIIEQECSGLLGLGMVLNLIGGAAEFEEMNGLIQSVTSNITTGETSVTFGPPKHLGPADLMEMLRGIRTRQRFTPTAARTTGVGGVSGSVQLGKDAAKESNTTGKAARMTQTWYRPDDPNGAMVKVDISEFAALMAANGHSAAQVGVIKPRMLVASRNNNGVCQNGKIYGMFGEFIPD